MFIFGASARARSSLFIFGVVASFGVRLTATAACRYCDFPRRLVTLASWFAVRLSSRSRQVSRIDGAASFKPNPTLHLTRPTTMGFPSAYHVNIFVRINTEITTKSGHATLSFCKFFPLFAAVPPNPACKATNNFPPLTNLILGTSPPHLHIIALAPQPRHARRRILHEVPSKRLCSHNRPFS
jgi:hypothetical protein